MHQIFPKISSSVINDRCNCNLNLFLTDIRVPVYDNNSTWIHYYHTQTSLTAICIG